MQLMYSPDYTLSGYAFDTTRKARWLADSLASEPISGVTLVAPEPVSEEQLCEVHDPAYVAAVRSGEPRQVAESQGFQWDARLWPMVRASTGGVLAAVRAALADGVAGSLSSGLHHAKRDHGDGYCTFNGLALAACEALALGIRSLLILDLDAHCGGGTHSLVGDDPRIHHVDIAVSLYDRYTPAGGNRCVYVEDPSRYLPVVSEMLSELAADGEYDLCLYNAGMDPHERCDIGGLTGITADILAERERMVFEWCGARRVPVAFVLAGGYIGPRLSQSELVALHRTTIAEAARLRAGT
jgi:acetoin utilization deacetylase AcuC-like enzyme